MEGRVICRNVSSKKNDYRSNAEKHRQQLEQVILESRQANDSGIDDDRDPQHDDDAVEVLGKDDCAKCMNRSYIFLVLK